MQHMQDTYGIPADLMAYVNVGLLEVVSENPNERTIEFHIPSMRERDTEGRTTSYSLTWINPKFNAQFCRHYEQQPGDAPNFELVMDIEDIGDDFVEPVQTVDELVGWLDGASAHVHRRKTGTPLPTPEELADAFCSIITSWLPVETVAEINRRNALPEYAGCCASHDFCDPNQAMIDAMWTFGVAFEPANDGMKLIDDAWEIAKQRGFATRENALAGD